MRLGPYELIRQIGAGGMGEVWVARRAGETVAIKRLPRRLAGDPDYRKTLLQEARLSQLLAHPNIVRIVDAGEAGGEVFIAMELIDGFDLARLTKLLALRGERVPIAVAAYVIAELLRGLAYAHNLEHEGELISLVHRDVSPHNVMLSSAGAVKLTDFGVARLSSEDTSGTHVKGKARYMPPEQLRGDSRSPAVDLFAVGAVFQELLDGAPFRGAAVDDARLLGMAIDGVVPRPRHPREIPGELERVRAGLLAADPRRRIGSALAALERVCAWPGYRDRSRQVAKLVADLREHEAELAGAPTQSGLAHQATFLHTNEVELEGSDLAALADIVEAPDRILLELAGDSDEAAARLEQPGVDEDTGQIRGHDRELARTHASGPGPAATGDQRARDPSLELDLAGHSFVRHVPTSPNPVIPARRSRALALVLGVGLLAAIGVGGWWFARERVAADEPAPETTLRSARVVGRGSLLDVGLRDRGLDRLVRDDIDFRYLVDPHGDPLERLARGEAEFALTTLAEFVDRNGDRGDRIVAIVGLPLATTALVFTAAEPGEGSRLAHTGADQALARALADRLAILEPPSVGLEDDAAVFAELERDGSAIVAGISSEPWIGRARAAGMTIAATGLDVPLARVDVLVASREVLDRDPELVAAVVATYYAGVAEAQGFAARVAEAHGLAAAEAETALAAQCLFDAATASSWLADGGAGLLAMVRPLLLPEKSAEASIAGWIEPRFALAAAAGIRGEPRTLAQACPSAMSVTSARTEGPRALGLLAHPRLAEPLFEPGRASPIEPTAIAELADTLAVFNPATISVEVIGHGDRRGSAGRKLGRARADAIVEALQQAGVALPLIVRGEDGGDAPASRVEFLLRRP
jgi:hypothetical protein